MATLKLLLNLKGGGGVPLSNGAPSGFNGMLRRRFAAQRVLVAVTGQGVTCAWSSQGQWTWMHAVWPDGACQEGIPQQPEAMADLVADLLLDAGIFGARVELLLPLELCDWRVVDDLETTARTSLDTELMEGLPWSFEPNDCYVSTANCLGSLLAVGVSRSGLQAWIDLFELADLRLNRVDWLLSAAWRGLQQQQSCDHSDVAWLLSHQQQQRLILLRHGVPEVDRNLGQDVEQFWPSINYFIEAWQDINGSSSSLQWQLTAPPSLRERVVSLAGSSTEWFSSEPFDDQDLQPFDPMQEPALLDPLVSLGLIGLGLER